MLGSKAHIEGIISRERSLEKNSGSEFRGRSNSSDKAKVCRYCKKNGDVNFNVISHRIKNKNKVADN